MMVRSPTVHLSDGIFDSAVPMGLGAFGLRGPRVETRGYFLTSLTGLTLGAPLIPALNPRLFSVAPSGLQEWGHTVAAFGMTHPLPHVGAAPRGCPPVRTGTRRRAGDGAWNMPLFVAGDGFFPPLVSPLAGVAAEGGRGWI